MDRHGKCGHRQTERKWTQTSTETDVKRHIDMDGNVVKDKDTYTQTQMSESEE